jgi:hypothetical protein
MELLFEIPKYELKEFDKLIREYRNKYIKNSQIIVDKVMEDSDHLSKAIKDSNISSCIYELRELSWHKYLIDEVDFNVNLMQNLHILLKTPKEIIDTLLSSDIICLEGDDLRKAIINICGEYAGRVFPYIYRISLSNTQSRRSRAGKTFEAIVYKIYELLEFPYDSQSRVGRKLFSDLGLGKKVDSILPGIDAYKNLRSKSIIGTMKTTLRERWQEVAEEIERTKIPVIHLLTADEDISEGKANEMNKHNIIIVAYDWVANSDSLKSMKNIISFEEYLFSEIPTILKYWENK